MEWLYMAEGRQKGSTARAARLRAIEPVREPLKNKNKIKKRQNLPHFRRQPIAALKGCLERKQILSRQRKIKNKKAKAAKEKKSRLGSEKPELRNFLAKQKFDHFN